jgi:hypothetical protein
MKANKTTAATADSALFLIEGGHAASYITTRGEVLRKFPTYRAELETYNYAIGPTSNQPDALPVDQLVLITMEDGKNVRRTYSTLEGVMAMAEGKQVTAFRAYVSSEMKELPVSAAQPNAAYYTARFEALSKKAAELQRLADEAKEEAQEVGFAADRALRLEWAAQDAARDSK